RDWLRTVLDYLEGNSRLLADLLAEHLPEVGYAPPEGTYLAWLDCRELGLGVRPAEFVRRHAGVAHTDGTLCGRAGAGFVRLTFGTPRPILTQIVQQLAAAVRAQYPDHPPYPFANARLRGSAPACRREGERSRRGGAGRS